MTMDTSKQPDGAPKLEEISDGDLDDAKGGAVFPKYDGIDGESLLDVKLSDMKWKLTPSDSTDG